MSRHHKKEKISQIICFCNNVSKQTIEEAILNGAQTLNEIYDKTTAGIGPCGGSCRRKIAPLLFEPNGQPEQEIDAQNKIGETCRVKTGVATSDGAHDHDTNTTAETPGSDGPKANPKKK